MKDLNELAREVHQANIAWWQDVNTGKPIERNKGELLALAIGEVAEALEGERKNRMDDHLPHRKNAEVEMADAYIRLLDFAGGFKLPIHRFEGFETPDNKGEGCFQIMQCVSQIYYPSSGGESHVSLALSFYYISAYCLKHGYDLEGAMREKMEYNRTRADHSHEARRAQGGKQF